MDINDYDRIKKQKVEVAEKEAELEAELSQIEEEQKKYIKELAMLEAKTEKQLEEINLAKREESTVNEEELHKKCKESIDYFLQDIAADQQFGFSLQIRIEYQQMKIFKNIVDENITFEKLKEETKNQFGKEFDEFFFADENGHLFLDGQRVTPALFPLSNVKVDKYEPVIYVVNKMSYKSSQINDTTKETVEFTKKKEEESNWTKLIKHYFKKNSIRLYFTIFIIIFTGLYSQNCINYRQAKAYRSIHSSFEPHVNLFVAGFQNSNSNVCIYSHYLFRLILLQRI